MASNSIPSALILPGALPTRYSFAKPKAAFLTAVWVPPSGPANGSNVQLLSPIDPDGRSPSENVTRARSIPSHSSVSPANSANAPPASPLKIRSRAFACSHEADVDAREVGVIEVSVGDVKYANPTALAVLARRRPVHRTRTDQVARATRHVGSSDAPGHQHSSPRPPPVYPLGGRLSTATRSSLDPALAPVKAAHRSRFVRPGPVKREVLAGAAGPTPLEAECLHLILVRGGPGGDLPRANLGAGGVVDLDACSLRARRPDQRVSTAPCLSGHLHAPVGEVVGDLELDRGVLDPSYFVDQLGEAGGPSARLSTKDRLERRALVLIRSLVDEEPHRGLRLTGPDIALERADRDDVQVIESHVAVAPLANMPGQDAVALPLVGCLSEGAAAWHPASANVEPIASESPVWSLGHRFLP